MSLPVSLLNSTNRQLREKIDELSVELSQKTHQCEDYRNVIRLLQSNLKQIRKEISTVEQSVTGTKAEVEREESTLLQWRMEEEGTKRRQRRLEEDLKALIDGNGRLENQVNHYAAAVATSVRASAVLEKQVKEAMEESIAAQKESDTLKQQQREVSNSVFMRLQAAQEEVVQMESAVAFAFDEHRRVLAELEAAQESLSSAVNDEKDTIRNLEVLQKQSGELDRRILANAEIMEDLKKEFCALEEEKKKLVKTLENCGGKKVEIERYCGASREHFDSIVADMRSVLQELVEQTKTLRSTRRIRRRIKQNGRSSRATLHSVEIQYQERAEKLQAIREYHENLIQCLKEEEKEKALSLVPGTTTPINSLNLLLNSLQRHLARIENHSYLLEDKLNSAVYALRETGDVTEDINSRILYIQQSRALQEKESSHIHEQLCAIREMQISCENSITDISTKINTVSASSREESQRRMNDLRSKMVLLQEKLSGEINRGNAIRASLTSAKIQLLRAQKAVLNGKASESEAKNKYILLENEILAMKNELQELRQASAAQESKQSSAAIARQLLLNASVQTMEDVAQVSGITELLRGQMEIQEAQMEAERQRLLVTLHLEQNSLSAIKEEYYRLSKNLDLVMNRCKESMETLSRLSSGEKMCPSFVDVEKKLLTNSDGSEEISPEVFHARYLLQKSCEREQLLSRGNFLDQRVVILSKEVETLKKMRDAMTNTMSSSNSHSSNATLNTRRNEDDIKDEILKLQGSEEQRNGLLREELKLHCDSITGVDVRKREVQRQLKELKSNLQRLKLTRKQKCLELSKLRDAARKVLHS